MQQGVRWRAILSAIGAYLFFMLQYFVPSEQSFELIQTILAKIHLDPAHVENKALFVSVVLFAPYVAFIYFLFIFFDRVISRITLSSRIEALDTEIEAITRYHKGHPIVEIIDKMLSGIGPHGTRECKKITHIMIDLLITDIRAVMQRLCQREDIRVALFVEAQREVEQGRIESVLSMIASTEFDKDYKHSTFFRKPYGAASYQGFCGAAWAKRRPVCGAFYRGLWPQRDNRFFLYNPKDKRRSFLCIPILESDMESAPISAILSIDSGSSLDFRLSEDLISELYIATKPVQQISQGYLEVLKILDN